MIPRPRWLPAATLLLVGAGWGLTTPLVKLAVEGGYRPFGIIFWQLVIGAAILWPVQAVRRQRLPLGRPHLRVYAALAALGTLFPNAATYRAVEQLPAGLVTILLSSVPMFAFAIALALGDERLGPGRLAGLVLGLAGVAMIVGPEAALPDRAMLGFVLLALVAPLVYGVEGNYMARAVVPGLDPLAVVLGASLVGLPVAAGLALVTGQWITPAPPWGMADLAVFASSAVDTTIYGAYVWLVARAGAVFAAQAAYLVTGFGVLWSVALLGESYSGWVWAAMGVMLAGLALVQPRADSALVPAAPAAKHVR
ncbi:DMT family transporter [Rhodovulum euryhalinum]|uniref:Drug/metabolite transporter (DMT)-like permease n=1 Tax=Rhodovulum euryhalinum TaxID=35805 RepID=A0A4R2KAJ1_9RHOB|nr:DMT family transporter [Rhodovulum euryhalinum]TCO70463.1 drug/metabolite transporter (DMT)-like permease [Rhodovulum euryhalinum]